MSRGHGTRQRQILERIEGLPGHRGLFVSPPDAKASDAAALRRAAYRLEREGLIQLRIHRGRLAMFGPDVDPPVSEGFVAGRDGRLYRSPNGQRLEDIEAEREKARAWEQFLMRYDLTAEQHGHPHGPGILLCFECAESAGADADLLDKLRAARAAVSRRQETAARVAAGALSRSR